MQCKRQIGGFNVFTARLQALQRILARHVAATTGADFGYRADTCQSRSGQFSITSSSTGKPTRNKQALGDKGASVHKASSALANDRPEVYMSTNCAPSTLMKTWKKVKKAFARGEDFPATPNLEHFGPPEKDMSRHEEKHSRLRHNYRHW